MLFNSLVFGIFLPVVFAVYWGFLSQRLKAQNFFLLIASYFFYGWWDWKFLALIVLSSLSDYVIAIGLTNQRFTNYRKHLLWSSVVINLGTLGFFKYFNFFSNSLFHALSSLGIILDEVTLNVVLPVGISFYTFQTLSYTIDVYRGKLLPSKSIVDFFAYVSFFPQLVAGPIERATHLLPQFQRLREFSYPLAVSGLRLFLWGMFKKVVIADNLAPHVDNIFGNSESLPGSVLLLGVIYFSFQIYCDFSGYSDMAVGLGRLFGFRLMTNFRFPYFSRDVAEFWRRWHISLSTWFRDYVYIPLGGSRVGSAKAIRNIFVIFLLSGFWHGANWTFLMWGGLNALYFIPLFFSEVNRSHLNTVATEKFLPSAREFFQIVATFGLTCLAWIIFRSESLSSAIIYYKRLFSTSLFSIPDTARGGIAFVFIIVGIEWLLRKPTATVTFNNLPKPIRWSVYIFLGAVIFFKGQFGDQQFIYFQF
jgi:alginate O-acetyltransferase complex protein AlgI